MAEKLRKRLGKPNQTLHQTPDSPAVLAGAGGGAGELVGVDSTNAFINIHCSI